jgi:hypothetical protein
VDDDGRLLEEYVRTVNRAVLEQLRAPASTGQSWLTPPTTSGRTLITVPVALLPPPDTTSDGTMHGYPRGRESNARPVRRHAPPIRQKHVERRDCHCSSDSRAATASSLPLQA